MSITPLLAWLGITLSTTALTAQSAAPVATTPSPAVVAAPAAVAVNLHRLARESKSSADNIKWDGRLGAQLWLIADPTFFTDWQKSETPKLDPLETGIRGQSLYTVIVFYGPARDSKGRAEIVYDVTVRKPDGSVYDERKGLPGYAGNAIIDERMLVLGQSYLRIALAPTDPAGRYLVEVTVTDTISKSSLSLRQTFTVQ